MPKLVSDEGEATAEINELLIDAGEEAGLSFGCTNGVCGSCEVEVTSGAENLIPRTQEEEDFLTETNNRLCCQMRFAKDGTTNVKGIV